MSEELNLNDYKTYEQVPGATGLIEATKEDGTQVRFKEDLMLQTMEHPASERQDYNLAYEKVKEDSGNTRESLEMGIADALADLEKGAADKKEPKAKPEAKPKDPTSKKSETVNGKEVIRDDYPQSAEWTPQHNPPHKVEVLGVYKDKIDGKTCYQIHSDEISGMENHPIPEDELKIDKKDTHEIDKEGRRKLEFKDGQYEYVLWAKEGDKLVVKTDSGYEADWVVAGFGKDAEGNDTIKVEKDYKNGDAHGKVTREEPLKKFIEWHAASGFMKDVEPATSESGEAKATTPEEAKDILENAKKELKAVRDNLVEVTIRRRARMNDSYTSSRKEDAELYDQLMSKYKDRLDKFLKALAADLEIGGASQEEIQKKLTIAEFAEQRAFIKREFSQNNKALDDIEKSGDGKGLLKKTWAKRAKFIRKWANMPTWAKVGTGVGVGLGIGLAATATLGVGVAGIAVGSAAKFSQGLLNKKASLRNVSQHSLDKELSRLKELEKRRLMTLMGSDVDMDEFRDGMVNETQEMLERRVAWAQRRNKIGNAVMLASGLVGGYGIAEAAGAPGIGDLIGDGVHSVTAPVGGLLHHGHHSSGLKELHPGSGNSSPDGGGLLPLQPGGGSHGAEGVYNGPSGSGHGMEGLYFHGSGHEAAVKLPGNLHLGQLNGHDTILDSNNHVVFGDNQHGIWNDQGRLTSSAIEHLKSLHYKVTEGHNFYDPPTDKWHYYTEVS